MDKDELLKALNRDLSIEYGLVMRYMILANDLHLVRDREAIEKLWYLSRESASHSRRVTELIMSLGGSPTTDVNPFGYTPDIRRVLETSLHVEKKTRESYKSIASRLEEGGESEMAATVRSLAGEEARHVKVLEVLLEAIG